MFFQLTICNLSPTIQAQLYYALKIPLGNTFAVTSDTYFDSERPAASIIQFHIVSRSAPVRCISSLMIAATALSRQVIDILNGFGRVVKFPVPRSMLVSAE